MVSRGVWNLHINERWYRSCQRPRGRISPPDTEQTFRMIKQLCDQDDRLESWELIPFRTPIHSSLDYLYTVDQDAGVFLITLWQTHEGTLRPVVICIDLPTLCASSHLLIKESLAQRGYIFLDSTSPSKSALDTVQTFGALDMQLIRPTPMNELQEQFFTDFVFMWRFYIDDPLTWNYKSPVFRVIAIAFLLAAWDFEVSPNSTLELPITFASIPSWDYPKAEVYWFHCFLVVLHESLETEHIVNEIVGKAKPHFSGRHERHNIRLILISPHHIVFAKISHNAILVSKSTAFLTNRSAIQCSPGFRALARLLTSDSGTKPLAARERWEGHVPPELLESILNEMDPRDTVAFSQASFTFRQCYYASVPQFNDTVVLQYRSSIPCCGIRAGLEEDGICCTQCFSWRHAKCVGLELRSSLDRFICVDCQDGETSALAPGRINRLSCHTR